jgi:hypothetical protein
MRRTPLPGDGQSMALRLTPAMCWICIFKPPLCSKEREENSVAKGWTLQQHAHPPRAIALAVDTRVRGEESRERQRAGRNRRWRRRRRHWASVGCRKSAPSPRSFRAEPPPSRLRPPSLGAWVVGRPPTPSRCCRRRVAGRRKRATSPSPHSSRGGGGGGGQRGRGGRIRHRPSRAAPPGWRGGGGEPCGGVGPGRRLLLGPP